MIFGTRLGAGDQEAILLGVPFILTIPFLLLWQRIVPHIGSRKSWMIGNALFLPGLIIMTLANNFYTGLLGTVLIAPGLAIYQLLPLPMLSDVIDDDARKHGYRREGIFFGMNGGIIKAAFSLQGLLLGIVFSISGYVSGAAVQSASAVWGIRFLIGITPIISIVISYLLLWKFPFGREHENQKLEPAAESAG
jgi:GPH family glycoside/pentoside/hexuronide:cation symporter